MIVLKNNKGVDDARARKVDYCFQFNGYLYQRLLKNESISFFSPHDVPGLYNAFCSDQEEFQRLYEKYEAIPSIRRRTLSAREAFSMFATERYETGRIYLQNIDHSNTHSPFDESVAPIEQSNLCMEIDLPSKPFTDVNADDGMISLCTLAAINWGNFNKPEDMQKACELAVRALDAVLDYQEYPIGHAERATKLYRPLGVGIINLAYFLAKRGLKYDDEALSTIHEWTEAWSYYLLKASVDLAKEQGRCDGFEDLKYAKGILPIDTYKNSIDELVPNDLKMPWDELRNEIAEYGIRNATVMALMPSETSSQISNSTNGIEPIRSLVTKKVSKDGVLSQVVPEIGKLKNKYDLLWDQKTPEGYIKLCGVLQKFIDQGISANTSYNPQHFQDAKVPMVQLLKDIMLAYKYGLKSLYYNNTMDNAKEVDVDKMIEENTKKEMESNPVLKFLKKETSPAEVNTDTTSTTVRKSEYDFTSRDDDNDCKDGCAI